MYRFFVVFILFLPLFSSAQGFQIHVDLKEAAGKEIFLANYYLGNIYAKDTLMLDEEGLGVFSGDTILPQGLYKIYLDEQNHFDFLLGEEQQFLIRNESFRPESLQIEGSEEAQAFLDYTAFFRDLQRKNGEIRKQLDGAVGEDRKRLEEMAEELTGRLHERWNYLEEAYPGSFLPMFAKAMYVPVPDISTLPETVQNTDSLLLKYRFYFQQKHFWDHFDHTDERFLYTPFFKQKLETWFTKVLFQHYDSVKIPVIQFIEEVRPYNRIFQFAASFFLNGSINSNIMGMDALFVDIARKYYLSGEAFWVTDESLAKIRENVLFAENNLVGRSAPDLTLESFDGEYFNLHQVRAEYTLVLIYEPNCSHCRVFIPELYTKVYQPFKERGLEVFAIYSMNDRDEWNEYLNDHQLFDWINVWDEHHVSRFKILYDARKTPVVYLLDRDKTIVAKRLSVEQVKGFMEQHLK